MTEFLLIYLYFSNKFDLEHGDICQIFKKKKIENLDTKTEITRFYCVNDRSGLLNIGADIHKDIHLVVLVKAWVYILLQSVVDNCFCIFITMTI